MGLVETDERVGVQAGYGVADRRVLELRLDPDRRQLDRLGAELAQGCREPARLSSCPGHHHPLAMKRPALEPGDRLAPGRDLAEEQDRRRAEAGSRDRFG